MKRFHEFTMYGGMGKVLLNLDNIEAVRAEPDGCGVYCGKVRWDLVIAYEDLVKILNENEQED